MSQRTCREHTGHEPSTQGLQPCAHHFAYTRARKSFRWDRAGRVGYEPAHLSGTHGVTGCPTVHIRAHARASAGMRGRAGALLRRVKSGWPSLREYGRASRKKSKPRDRLFHIRLQGRTAKEEDKEWGAGGGRLTRHKLPSPKWSSRSRPGPGEGDTAEQGGVFESAQRSGIRFSMAEFRQGRSCPAVPSQLPHLGQGRL